MPKTSFYKKRNFQIKLYGVLSIILFLLIGYYTFTNLTKMFDMRAQISSNEQLHNALLQTNNSVDEELTEVREENQELVQRIDNELNFVFPENEEHTILTRTLEQFSNDINRKLEPFIISNLQYLAAQAVQGNDYKILPVKMTIHSSYNNFFNFLEYVENSGTLSDKTRLLDIESIIINFVSPSGTQGNLSGQNEINFNVSMNAYFRNTD